MLALGLLVYNKKYGMRTSGLLWLFWFFLGLCGIVQYRSLLRKTYDEVSIILITASIVVYIPINIFYHF